MKRLGVMFCLLVLFCGSVEGKLWTEPQWKLAEGKEIWRKELGADRCLLLYKEETGEREMYFADGPWLHLTEELVERIRAAGLCAWERETGGGGEVGKS